ncbi:glycoside hydrolase family 28 protein [Athelia psychrophila]|uniref:endo-polygalacturonase n=1 Tax=Athelia psychrophila TaxID=1759441 RepID=A0A165Y3B0_9AGAM|nr:glycoside hydrolase family 28 protein [Fibularhizoctonia sp. CBS 109695]
MPKARLYKGQRLSQLSFRLLATTIPFDISSLANMFKITVTFALALLGSHLSMASPTPQDSHLGKRCTATISSASDVTAANLACTTINIESFTMTAGETLAITGLASGTAVNLLGEVTFGVSNWAGPLFEIGTSSDSGTFAFNGNGNTFNGQGASYWDGEGTNGGVTKPHPMLKIIKGGGTFKDVTVLNSPAQAVSVGNTATMVVSAVTIDNSAGTAKGHNTDCFDVSASDLTITGSTCMNQDDCLAINKGSSITFSNNKCSGGHGISIGSIASDKAVSGVTISGNTITNSVNGLRIKTDSGATDASVTDVVYSGNTASGITQYGVVIEQDYENGSPTGTPTNGVTLGPVTFSGTNTIAVSSGAEQVYVLCGTECTGTWDWSGLKTSGGTAGSINYKSITGYP